MDVPTTKEEILKNVYVIWSALSPNKSPKKNSLGNRFEIFVHMTAVSTYQGLLLYGPANRVFIIGRVASDYKDALTGLLDATCGIPTYLFEKGKLPNMDKKKAIDCGVNGLFDPTVANSSRGF